MKTNIQLSVDADLLVEARGAGFDGKFSKLFEEILKQRIRQPLNQMQIEEQELMKLKEIRVRLHELSTKYPDTFKKAVRWAHFRDEKRDTNSEKIVFWERVEAHIQDTLHLKENAPTPPKEKH